MPQILPRLAFLFALSALVVYFHGTLFDVKIPLNPAPFTLTGVALAIFLGFRNSAGYDRFWEARKILGALLNESRTLARQAVTLTTLPSDSQEIKIFLRHLIAVTYALKHQLRGTDCAADLKRLLGDAEYEKIKDVNFKAAFLLRYLSQWTRDRMMAGEMDPMTRTSLDATLVRISDCIGGCERIAGTPIPYAYGVLLHRTVYVYCLSLPFGLTDSIGWATPFFAVFIGYTFMALDEVVTQIEDPFGTEDHDLPLDYLARFIEISVEEIEGKPHPEGVPRPENYLLT